MGDFQLVAKFHSAGSEVQAREAAAGKIVNLEVSRKFDLYTFFHINPFLELELSSAILYLTQVVVAFFGGVSFLHQQPSLRNAS